MRRRSILFGITGWLAIIALVMGWQAFLAMSSVNVSDVHSPAATQEKLANANPVVAKHAMVVTAQHLATQVGIDILKQGGNAIDAAVAIGYAEAVVHPCCGNLGGGGFMTLHLADGTNTFLDFRETAPGKARPDMYLDDQGQVIKGLSTQTYLATGVPGTAMGLNTALEKYGTLPLATVMAPAIRLARNGYLLKQGDADILNRYHDKFARNPHAARIFLNHGIPWKAGDRLIQTDLANTLKMIAQKGSNAFYHGAIARAIVAASKAHHGRLSLADFANYQAKWRVPVTCQYEGYTLVAAPPPSSGGVTLCEILAMAKPWPLKTWGYGSAKTVHYLAEAERRAFADRNTYLGDPDFVTNPVKQLLSSAHINALRATIRKDKATPSIQIKGRQGATEGRHTTHYSVLDADGNAVSVTYTINYLFGNGLIAGHTGFLLNNEMDDFTAKPGVPNSFGLIQGKANKIEPGKRPLSSMSPTIVLKKGDVFMVTGSPGGSTIISTTLLSMLNVIDFNMNAQQAVNAPRMHEQWWPEAIYIEPGLLTQASKDTLKSMGHTFKKVPHWGAAEAIVVNPVTGMIEGANDRRRPAGKAIGY